MARLVEAQRQGCEIAGSTLYANVLAAVLADVTAGGPCADVLGVVAGAAYEDAVVLRFLAAVHELVLGGRCRELAAFYPSAGGEVGPGIDEAFLAAVESHSAELSAAMHSPVQTNEVGRSVALLVGYLRLARHRLPLRVLEVGASAGLNLWFDRYRYEAGDWAVGPAGSPLRFVDPFEGTGPATSDLPEVAERGGCDAVPLDPSAASDRRRLRSFVWPDQLDRLRRLDAALDVVGDLPAVVVAADAVEWSERELRRVEPGRCTVLTHSIVLQYLSGPQRSALVQIVEEAGARATTDAPLAWLRMEPAGSRAEVRLTEWPAGVTRTIATSTFHGPPVTLTRQV